jgi:hypothetical protein
MTSEKVFPTRSKMNANSGFVFKVSSAAFATFREFARSSGCILRRGGVHRLPKENNEEDLSSAGLDRHDVYTNYTNLLRMDNIHTYENLRVATQLQCCTRMFEDDSWDGVCAVD